MADRDPGPFVADPAAFDVDVYAWTRAQAALLRARQFDSLDLDNVIEEIESLGSEQGYAIESHLIVLVEHLLKLAVSADIEPRRGWRATVRNQRRQIERRLRKNPSLRRELPEYFSEQWPAMREQAADGLREAEEHLVPANPPFTLEQALDPDWFPAR